MKRIICIILFAVLLLNNSCLHPRFVESDMVMKANNAFCLYLEQMQDDKGKVDFHGVYDRWMAWYHDFVEKNR